jgi:hypothetical protein
MTRTAAPGDEFQRLCINLYILWSVDRS